MWNYVATAQRPTVVTHSVVGNFTSPDELNLIVGKSTRLEVHLLTPDGLQPILDFGVYGKIESLELFRPPGENQDSLFICTESHEFCVLSFNSTTEEIETKAAGDIKDVAARTSAKQIAIVDPECRLIGLNISEGYLKVIPFGRQGEEQHKLKEAFNLAIEEKMILDMKFLWGASIPTVAVLFKDLSQYVHLKTYEVNVRDKTIHEGKLALQNLAGANKLISVPFGGVLIIGEETITYYNGTNTKSISMKRCLINSFCEVGREGTKYLLGDHNGQLYGLTLESSNQSVRDIKLEHLGETSIPNTISYLDNSFVFIGSIFGDSQLIRLNDEKDEEGSWVEEVETYTNLGPIVDFCVVDLDRQGQGQLVTCSGAFKDGSLRVVRNGIGINEQATVELPGIKGIWTLPSDSNNQGDKYIVLSFVGETRVLAMTDDELEETEISGFESKEQTIFCSQVLNNRIIQVTAKSVNLVDSTTMNLVSKWAPPSSSKINVASAKPGQILLGIGGGKLVYLEVDQGSLKEIGNTTLEHEISCVNINSLGNSDKASLCAVGLWTDMSVRLLEIPTLKEVAKEVLGGEVIPRSVQLISFEDINYLLCGLGDGHLFSFVLHPANFEFQERRKISLGTQPIVLNTFVSEGIPHVFAASDQPTVIYSSNKKLLFSNVDLKQVNYMCAFRSESFPDSLAITTDESLTIGTIDKGQKLNIITIPLGETPRRIAHQPQTKTYGVITIKDTHSYFKIFDEQTFEVLDEYALDNSEDCTAITSVSFEGDNSVYYVVGTAYIIPEEQEPSKGRILVFKIEDHKIKLVSGIAVNGSVYSLKSFNGKLLTTVNATVSLYNWGTSPDGSKGLVHECLYKGFILALFLQTRGDFIIVGDLMNSIHLLLYKPEEKKIEEIARDFNANWMSALEVIDDDNFIGSDGSHNIFTLQRNVEATSDEERSKLKVVGNYHVGEFVNRFQHGSLVMKLPDPESLNLQTIIYASVAGSIGVIASIPQDMYEFFLQVQERLTNVIRGLGGFSHSKWREFKNEKKRVHAKNFLDGDLIESFLDLPTEKMKEVVKDLGVSSEELFKKIETLQRAVHQHGIRCSY